jgi:hypothetical protein
VIDRSAVGLLFDEEGTSFVDGGEHGSEVAGRQDDVVAEQELAMKVPLSFASVSYTLASAYDGLVTITTQFAVSSCTARHLC